MPAIGYNPENRFEGYFTTPQPTPLRRLWYALQADVPKVHGTDVSHYQGTINFAAMYAAGYRFVIIKATEGVDFLDPKFEENWKKALDAGFKVGVYHFFRDEYKGEDQAHWHLENIRPLVEDTLGGIIVPHLDVEINGGLDIDKRQARCYHWNQEIQVEFPTRHPGMYSSPYLKKALLGDEVLGDDWDFWDAHWTSASQPTIPVGVTRTQTRMWQYGVAGKYSWCPTSVPGVQGNCDVDWFFGTEEDLDAYAAPFLPGTPPPSDLEERVTIIEQKLAAMKEVL